MELLTFLTRTRKFRAGETAKRILTRKAVRDRQRALSESVAEEKRPGTLSDEVADIILDFCLTKRRSLETQINEGCIPTLLMRVKEITRGQSTLLVLIKLPKRITLVRLYKLLRPADYRDEYWLEHRAGWLSTVLVNVEPDVDIRDTAIHKVAERFYHSNWGELNVRPDLEEIWNRRLKSLLKIQRLESI